MQYLQQLTFLFKLGITPFRERNLVFCYVAPKVLEPSKNQGEILGTYALIRKVVNQCTLTHTQVSDSPLSEAPGPFPWTAALLADGVYVCGASIIHQQFVMTGVHCAQKLLRYVPSAPYY